MRKIKMQTGITLIALIITIIVLLILAGVAIASVQDSGIIGKAKEAVEKHEAGKADEESKLQGYQDFLESYMSGQQGEGEIVTPPEEGGDDVVVTPPVEDEGENPPPTTDMPKATVGIKVEENSTIDGKAYSSTNPIIPAGFTPINTTTSNWDAENGPEVDNGLVIRDDSGNEFVWVPVTDDISTTQYTFEASYREPDVITGDDGISYDAVVENLQRANCKENSEDADEVLTSEDFKVELTNMYKSMAESVNKYDGFYVGRFETSRNGENPQSKRSSGTIYDETYIKTAYNSSAENDWYGLYALNKKYSTNSVQGSMIWGIQYDKMMSWMGDASNTTITEYNKERTCGTAEKDVIKNVYDIYGNSKEWTCEVGNIVSRISRGGCYGIDYLPRERYPHGNPTITDGFHGSRLTLYVM